APDIGASGAGGGVGRPAPNAGGGVGRPAPSDGVGRPAPSDAAAKVSVQRGSGIVVALDPFSGCMGTSEGAGLVGGVTLLYNVSPRKAFRGLNPDDIVVSSVSVRRNNLAHIRHHSLHGLRVQLAVLEGVIGANREIVVQEHRHVGVLGDVVRLRAGGVVDAEDQFGDLLVLRDLLELVGQAI